MNIQGETEKRAESARPHLINVQNRRLISLNGIEDVISFDENGVLMKSSLGTLSVDGDGLHIIKLNTEGGEVIIEGKLNGLIYLDDSQNEKRGGKLKRLLR